MVSKCKLIWSILSHKKDPVKVEAAKESVRVIALKRQVSTLEEINCQYAEQVKIMSKELANQKQGDFQDKVLDMAVNLFSPKMITPVIPASTENQTQLESGVQYSDDDLISMTKSLSPIIIQQLKSLSIEKFGEVVKQQMPKISESSIIRAKEIIGSIA